MATVRARVALAVGCLLAAALIVPRAAVLGQGLWHDEIYTIQQYVSGGPSAIFGRYGTNDHMLFNLLAWLTVRLPGLPDGVYRVWGAAPFLMAVGGVAWWLKARAGTVAALAFAFLAAASPMLLELTTEARGYGLAFLAMAALVVGGHEATVHDKSRRWATGFCLAGVTGTWTLPTFVAPWAGASIGLLLVAPRLGPLLARRLAISCAAVAAWYAPTLGDLLHSTGQQYGDRLAWHAPVTGGFNLFAAAFHLTPDSRAARAVVFAVVIPIVLLGLRQARLSMPAIVAPSALAVVITFSVLAAARLFVQARFLSYLLVPLFVYAALGLATLFRLATGSARFARIAGAAGSGVALAVAAAAGARWAQAAGPTLTRPFEANRAAAAAIAAAARGGTVPVLGNLHSPDDLRYYLPRSVRLLVPPRASLERRLCAPHPDGVVFVQEPFRVTLASTSCLSRADATQRRFRQRARGKSITVWIVPPAARPS